MRSIRYIIILSATIFLLSGCQRFKAQPELAETPKAKLAEPNAAEVPVAVKAKPADINAIRAVCELIYKGEFEAAGDLMGQFQPTSSEFDRLAKIIAEYRKINERRRSDQQAAFKEQLDKLEEFRTAAETIEANDVNEVNDIPKILVVVARASEFANEQQKEGLLSDTFVQQTFEKAKAKAAEFESEGKWIDAYIVCYNWLAAIEKDNKEYTDYAEELYEKANIVASFQNSPCETRQERYTGIKKQMFIRAIDTLNFNYVGPIDYAEMATKAIKRCRLLTEVMSASFDEISKANAAETPEGNSLSRPDSEEAAAWAASLETISAEIEQSVTGITKDKFIDVFEKTLALNEATVQIPPGVLISQFADAALSALDPYTLMVWPKQVTDFEKALTSKFTGIGILISKKSGLLTAESLLPDTPAYNSGLDAGDVIEKVDGTDTKDMTLECAVKQITGPAGTKVTLTVRSPGEDHTRDITITRAEITVPTISGSQRTEQANWIYMIDNADKIGYVSITNFGQMTSFDLEKTLAALETEGMRGLILDLRFNNGGLLNSAIEVTDKFIEEGLIVSTRPRFGVSTYALAHKEKRYCGYPLVILINGGSASASEIVAGALADKAHKRAILVGERTHGKGSVQTTTSYPGEGAQLKYTMAYWYLPSGTRVPNHDEVKKAGREDWGIAPDIEVKLTSNELKKMLDVQKDNQVLVKAGHDNSARPVKRHILKENLEADPQMAVALLVLKSKLIEAEVETEAVVALRRQSYGASATGVN
jgi:carboxyl-terminal processing protease